MIKEASAWDVEWHLLLSYITLATQAKVAREAGRDSPLSPFHMGKGCSDAEGKAVIKETSEKG